MARAFTALAIAALLGALAAPTVAASGVPEPYICGAVCVIVLQIVVPCAVAEAQQDALDQGTGCAMINVAQDFAACTTDNVLLALGFGNGCRA